MRAEPAALALGWVTVGDARTETLELVHCGAQASSQPDVLIRALDLLGADHEGEAIGLDCSLLRGGVCPTEAAPLMLRAGDRVPVRVRYAPATAAVDGVYGASLHSEAALVVHAAPEGGQADDAMTLDVTVSAGALGTACPVPRVDVGDVLASGHARPLDGFELDFAGSQAAPESLSPLVAWEAEIEGPEGRPVVWAVDAADPTRGRVHTPWVGEHRVALDVEDLDGVASCASAIRTVEVRPQAEIYVELRWEPVEAGDAPADLDLHAVHPFATGHDVDGDGDGDGWFDLTWSCFWFARTPDWGAGDVELRRQDATGDGPEAFALAQPAAGLTYRVGVHHAGGGPARATLDVHLGGELVRRVANVTLVDGDLWDVVHVHSGGGEADIQTGPSGQMVVYPDVATPAGL